MTQGWKTDQSADIDLKSIVSFLGLHLKTLAIFASVGCAVGYGLIKTYPNYRTTSRLHVKPNSGNPLMPLLIPNKLSESPAESLKNRLSSFAFFKFAADLLLQNNNLPKTYEAMLMESFKESQLKEKSSTTKALLNKLDADWLADYLFHSTTYNIENSDYIAITVTTPLEAFSQYLSVQLVQSAVDYALELNESESKRARSYITTKLENISKQRNEISEKLKALQKNSNFFGGSHSESGFFGLGIDEVKAKLTQAQLSLKENLLQIRSFMDIASKRALTLSESTIMDNLEAENEILRIRVKSLEGFLKNSISDKGDFASTLSDFQVFKNELELISQLHNALTEKQVQLDVESLSGADRISIFELSRPDKVRPLVPPALGVAAGMLAMSLLAVGIILLQSSLFPKVISMNDVARFDIGRLSTLPSLAKSTKNKILFGGTARGFPEQFDSSLGQRAFKNLRRSVLNVIDVKKYKTLVVSSPHPANGKSTIVFNLALGLASINKRVLVVDSDVVHPNATKRFGLQGKTGVCDFARGLTTEVRDCIHEVTIPQKSSASFKVHVLPIGQKGSGSLELSTSSNYRKLLESVKDQYDIILVDTPPILASTDGNEAIRQADMVILSFVHGRTRITEVMATLQNMPPRKHEDTYAVLNFVPRWSSEETNSYYYSYLETNTKRKKTTKQPTQIGRAA